MDLASRVSGGRKIIYSPLCPHSKCPDTPVVCLGERNGSNGRKNYCKPNIHMRFHRWQMKNITGPEILKHYSFDCLYHTPPWVELACKDCIRYQYLAKVWFSRPYANNLPPHSFNMESVINVMKCSKCKRWKHSTDYLIFRKWRSLDCLRCQERRRAGMVAEADRPE